MTSDLILFLILAIISVSAALGMLFSRNAIYPKEMLLESVLSANMTTPREVEPGVYTHGRFPK